MVWSADRCDVFARCQSGGGSHDDGCNSSSTAQHDATATATARERSDQKGRSSSSSAVHTALPVSGGRRWTCMSAECMQMMRMEESTRPPSSTAHHIAMDQRTAPLLSATALPLLSVAVLLTHTIASHSHPFTICTRVVSIVHPLWQPPLPHSLRRPQPQLQSHLAVCASAAMSTSVLERTRALHADIEDIKDKLLDTINIPTHSVS